MDSADIAKNKSLADHLSAYTESGNAAERQSAEDVTVEAAGRHGTISGGASEGRTDIIPAGATGDATTPGSRPVPVVRRPRKMKAKPEVIEDPREQALKIFEDLGAKYKETYEQSGIEVADRNLMLALRKHQRAFIDGGIYTAKELDDRVADLQKVLKSSGSDGTASMEDIFHRWLNEPMGAVQ